ncbi:peptidylprolyl isomerase [bacterium]|nr:peptidylprolyl isomerase [bacterium]
MKHAEDGDRVRVHYTGTLEDGTQFDSSRGRKPLEFVLGEGSMIAGFERAVRGMAETERRTVLITAEEAYGPHRDEMIMDIERDQFPVDVPLELGQHFRFDGNDGSLQIMRVVALDERTVTLDGNHPLAGENLQFDIELIEIAR